MSESPDLNYHVLEKILFDSQVALPDILSFGSTCKLYHHLIIRNEEFWEMLYKRKRWFRFYEIRTSNNLLVDFHRECVLTIKLYEESCSILLFMTHIRASNTRSKRYETLLNDWNNLYNKYENAWFYITDFLRKIVLNYDSMRVDMTPELRVRAQIDVTRVARIALRYVNQLYATEKYKEFLLRDPKFQIIEEGVWYITKFCDYTTEGFYEDLDERLDSLAQQAAQNICTAFCLNYTMKLNKLRFQIWRKENISRNFWENEVIGRYLRIIYSSVLYKFSFLEVPSDVCLLNTTLTTFRGQPWFVLFLMASIVRRLGFTCILRDDCEIFFRIRDRFGYRIRFERRKVFKSYEDFELERYFSTASDMLNKGIPLVIRGVVFEAFEFIDRRVMTELIYLINTDDRDLLKCLWLAYSNDVWKNKEIENFLIEKFQESGYLKNWRRMQLIR